MNGVGFVIGSGKEGAPGWAVPPAASRVERAGQFRLGRAGLRRSGRGKRLAGLNSVSSRVLAHSQK
jgi:hypothetical protein